MVATMDASLVAAYVTHERLVDLQLAAPEVVQICERGITGAEIIHRDVHAQVLELVQRGDRLRGACMIVVSVISELEECRAGRSRKTASIDLTRSSAGTAAATGSRDAHVPCAPCHATPCDCRHASRSTQ